MGCCGGQRSFRRLFSFCCVGDGRGIGDGDGRGNAKIRGNCGWGRGVPPKPRENHGVALGPVGSFALRGAERPARGTRAGQRGVAAGYGGEKHVAVLGDGHLRWEAR